MFLNLITSKLGISAIAIFLVLAVGGIQQLRINSYQSNVKALESEKKVLNIAIELKEIEAVDLQMAIEKQNTLVHQLKTSAIARKKERETVLLALKFKHMQDFKSLNQGEGPEDLNLWLNKALK